MPKKVTKKSSPALREDFEDVSTIRKRGKASEQIMARDYKVLLKEFASNPAVRYVAGGIATAFLTRLASNLSQRYPEISNVIKDSLNNVEGRLGEFRNNLADNVRH